MSRIIAGSAGGRRITAPTGDETRPTTDRVKEALFSSLSSWFGTSGAPAAEELAGVGVLDLFAGSGALALEAASRGAEPVIAVERNRTTATLITKNTANLGLGVTVESSSVASFLAGPPKPVDLVLADPPYPLSETEIAQLLMQLASGWLLSRGLVVLERSKHSPAPNWPAEFCETWQRDYGETTLHFGVTDEQTKESA